MDIPRSGPARELEWRHRQLLGTLAELLDDLDRSADDDADGGRARVEALRAILWFLRHGVLAFAHTEERRMLADAFSMEAAALEHAFLEAEIESFGREARALLRAGGASSKGNLHPSGPGAESLITSASPGAAMRPGPLPTEEDSGGDTPDGCEKSDLQAVRRAAVSPLPPSRDADALERVRRRLHRIEAVLEMHVLRDAEAGEGRRVAPPVDSRNLRESRSEADPGSGPQSIEQKGTG